jgi:chaperone BCS1
LLIEDVDAFFRQRDVAHTQVKLSFSGFLNALDGVATQEGTVLFMTTNHVGALDDALIRAGRIDERIELTACNEEQLTRLYLKFNADALAARTYAQANVSKALSPAQVQDALLREFGAVK